MEFVKRSWILLTTLPDRGRISIDGIEDMGEVVFPHPNDDSIVLRCGIARAKEISEWNYERSRKMNLKIVLYEKPNDENACPSCGGLIVIDRSFQSIDVIHSIPFCPAFKKQGNGILSTRKI